mmetsp:Transcript_12400/g.39809  ORF Transcript_12400/g.39809 Transcript_12400/m.39809 type:complete len:359 (-) Transcript_12400:25-1101(-)
MMVDGRLPQRVARVAEAVVRRLLVLEQVDAVGVAAQGAGLRGGGGRAFHGHPAGADAVAVGVGERPLLAREALVRSGGGLAVLRHVAAGRAGRVAGAGRLVLVGGGPVGVGPEHARVGVARARRVLGVAAGRLARVALAGPAAVAGVLSVWVVVARAPDGAVDALVRRLERLVDEEGVRGAGGLLVEAAPGRVVVAEPAVDEALAVDGAEALLKNDVRRLSFLRNLTSRGRVQWDGTELAPPGEDGWVPYAVLSCGKFGLGVFRLDDAGRPAATPSKAGHDDRPPAPFDVAIEGLAEDGSRELYYLGIIDILQKYTIRKHIETDINIVTKGLGKYRECSCVSPDAYRDRFLKFITHIF